MRAKVRNVNIFLLPKFIKENLVFFIGDKCVHYRNVFIFRKLSTSSSIREIN